MQLSIGIDWADQKHDIFELALDTQAHQYSVISSRPEAIQSWALDLQHRYHNQRVVVVCELKKGPLVYALMKYQHIAIVPVHPATFARYRKAFQPSGAKGDPSDARLQAEMVMSHPDKFSLISPASPKVRVLAQLVESRRKIVQDRVDLTNSITWHLKNYYPQALDWVAEKDSQLFIDLLQRWPILDQIKRARSGTLKTFMHQHNVRKPELIESRIKAIKHAVPLCSCRLSRRWIKRSKRDTQKWRTGLFLIVYQARVHKCHRVCLWRSETIEIGMTMPVISRSMLTLRQ
jgi:hypothetical protein